MGGHNALTINCTKQPLPHPRHLLARKTEFGYCQAQGFLIDGTSAQFPGWIGQPHGSPAHHLSPHLLNWYDVATISGLQRRVLCQRRCSHTGEWARRELAAGRLSQRALLFFPSLVEYVSSCTWPYRNHSMRLGPESRNTTFSNVFG